jgi:hypothetical protein
MEGVVVREDGGAVTRQRRRLGRGRGVGPDSPSHAGGLRRSRFVTKDGPEFAAGCGACWFRRFSCGLIALLCGGAVALGAASASAQEGSEGSQSSSAVEEPDPRRLDDEVRREDESRRRREEWLRGDEARQERTESRTRYRGVTPAQARAALLGEFGGLLDGLASTAADLGPGGRFREFLDDFTARVATPEGDRIVRSWLPLRVAGADGDKRPVDLTLRDRAGGFAAVNPLVTVWLPGRSSEPVRFGPEAIPMWLEGASGSMVAQRLDERGLFFADVYPDTDVVLASLEAGAEVLWHVRSPQSPEAFVVRFDLPAGATLEKRSETGLVAVVRGSEVLAQVRAPHVVDAQGERVPASVQVSGERVTITVAHRSADVAYPIAVDPPVEDHRGWFAANPSGLWEWDYQSQPSLKAQGYQWCFWFSWSYCYSFGGFGLHVFATNQTWENGEFGQYVYNAPNQTAYVSRAEFNYMNFDWQGSCCSSVYGYTGLWNGSIGNWASVRTVGSPYTYRSDVHTAGPGARAATFGETFSGSGYRPTSTVHYLGSALLYLDDPEAPSLWATLDVPAGAGPGGWVRQGAFTVASRSEDQGTGIRRTGIDSASSAPSSATTTTLPCSGAKDSLCPVVAQDAYTLPSDTLPEGVSALSAYAEPSASAPPAR